MLAAFAVRSGWLTKIRAFRLRWTLPWISGLTLFVACPWLVPLLGAGACLGPTLQGLSTVLLMFWLLSGEGGVMRTVLESWPVVQLGLLSYSLYVWQEVFLTWQGLSWLRFPWNLLASITVAVLCYRFWELPMRRRIRKWFHQVAQ